MNNDTLIRTPQDTMTTCSHCQRSIYVHEQVKTVTVADEVFDSISCMDVLHAKCTHMFCNQCWDSFDFESIRIPRTNITTEDEDKYLAIICEGLREQSAKELQLDPTSLTIDQINNWRIDKEWENATRSEIAQEQGIHPTAVTDAQLKARLFEDENAITDIYIPPKAPVDDPAEKIDILWAFIEGIGFDPNKVLSNFETHAAYQVGYGVGRIHVALSEGLREDAAKFWEFGKSNAKPEKPLTH